MEMPLRSQQARAVTRGAVRCSAWLGDSIGLRKTLSELLQDGLVGAFEQREDVVHVAG